jgi:hypothetical protein
MIKEYSWLEDGRHSVAGTSGSTHLSPGQEDRVARGAAHTGALLLDSLQR